MDWLEIAVSSTGLFLRDVIVPLGWQITVLTLVLMFRAPIGEAISRLRKLGKDGAELGPSQQEVGESSARQGSFGKTPPGPDATLNHQSDPTLLPFFERFKQALEGTNYANERDAMIDLIVTEQRRAYSETILRHIFGSQVTFLEEILASGESDADTVRRHFNAHKAKSEDKSFATPEEWLAYLINSNLIVGAYPSFTLTDTGKALLAYFRANSIDARRLGL